MADAHTLSDIEAQQDARLLRRRLAAFALGIRNRDLVEATGLSQVQVSNVLSARSRLMPRHAQQVARLVTRRALELFSDEDAE